VAVTTPVVGFGALTLVIVPLLGVLNVMAGVSDPKLDNPVGVTVMVEVVPIAPTVAPEFTVVGLAAIVKAGGVRAN
jgi:hypothetical protein